MKENNVDVKIAVLEEKIIYLEKSIEERFKKIEQTAKESHSELRDKINKVFERIEESATERHSQHCSIKKEISELNSKLDVNIANQDNKIKNILSLDLKKIIIAIVGGVLIYLGSSWVNSKISPINLKVEIGDESNGK